MLASQRFRRGAREPLAQSVEHLPFKQGVAGSNPARLMFTTPESTATVLLGGGILPLRHSRGGENPRSEKMLNSRGGGRRHEASVPRTQGRHNSPCNYGSTLELGLLGQTRRAEDPQRRHDLAGGRGWPCRDSVHASRGPAPAAEIAAAVCGCTPRKRVAAFHPPAPSGESSSNWSPRPREIHPDTLQKPSGAFLACLTCL